MGKKKLKQDIDAEEVVEKRPKNEIEEELPEQAAEEKQPVKNKKTKDGFRFARMGANIKTSSKFAKNHFISYENALKMIKTKKGAGNGGGVVKKQLLRHISLPYHMSGKSTMQDSIEWIAQNTVGKYKKEANGIVVAVGDVKIASPPRVVGDQFVFHLDVIINQIVFTPKVNDEYEAVVKYVENGLVVAVVMDMASIHIKQSEKVIDDGIGVEDTILVKYSAMEIKQSLCHLKGNYIKLVKKVIKSEPEEEEKLNNKTVFKDEDEEDDLGEE